MLVAVHLQDGAADDVAEELERHRVVGLAGQDLVHLP